MVMCVTAAAGIIVAATVSRSMTNSMLNSRSNDLSVEMNAAEAATEKVFAMISYDFQNFGAGGVVVNLGKYQTNVPSATTEDSYWNNFVFSDAQGHINQTYVGFISNYTGALPSQYPGLFTAYAPIYRVISNVQRVGSPVTAAVQEDVLLALVPLTQYAIFYNGLLEFSTCATMTVNGRVHANGAIYTGTGASLTFNGTVTTTSTLSSPANNGQGPWSFPGGTFNGSPTLTTNVPTVTLSIGATNVHSSIEMPPAGESPTSTNGVKRLYNQAQTVLLVSNSWVSLTIQNSVNNQVPGADPLPIVLSSTNTVTALATNFPFLSTTNTFYDERELKTNQVTQIDVGKYAKWVATNSSILTKFPTGSGTYPTILYVADNRTANSLQLDAVRLTNGIAPPVNGGLGFSVATPNPLYVMGNYNCTNSAYLGTTNTTATVPCALMSDALTMLSPSWKDSASWNYKSGTTIPAASSMTVNAAILTGVVPSTGTSSSTFSGGVHNLPRLLEDWGNDTLTLNTAIMNLFNSTLATHKFVNPGTYYQPPTRAFSYDLNFMNPAKQPPGIPCALVPIRFNYALPPPNTTSYVLAP
jgi:hypothetical protein